MKKTFQIISYTSITLFGILWISSKFMESNDFNNIDIRNILVLVHLFTSLKYYRIMSKEKDDIIKSLREESERKQD